MTWKNFPVPDTISAPLAAGIALETLFPTAIFDPPPFSTILATALLVAAVSSMTWSAKAAGDHDINSPGTLITSGPFSISRNPMYVSWFAVVIAAFCLTGSLWFVLCLAVAFFLTHYVAILPEETFLEKQFGDSYLEYRKRVRRYL